MPQRLNPQPFGVPDEAPANWDTPAGCTCHFYLMVFLTCIHLIVCNIYHPPPKKTLTNSKLKLRHVEMFMGEVCWWLHFFEMYQKIKWFVEWMCGKTNIGKNFIVKPKEWIYGYSLYNFFNLYVPSFYNEVLWEKFKWRTAGLSLIDFCSELQKHEQYYLWWWDYRQQLELLPLPWFFSKIPERLLVWAKHMQWARSLFLC